MLHFHHTKFHPVIKLPEKYDVYDFTTGYDADRMRESTYGIGKYNEKRKGMYEHELFQVNERNIHVGIDIAAPIGTKVHAFAEGKIYLFGYNSAEGDYGATLITEHEIESQKFYALFGHLSKKSLDGKIRGQGFDRGEVIAWIGDKSENGGWNPHLHFQLSISAPTQPDLPGVVAEIDLSEALNNFPDPRIVLGRVYE